MLTDPKLKAAQKLDTVAQESQPFVEFVQEMSEYWQISNLENNTIMNAIDKKMNTGLKKIVASKDIP